MMPGQTFLNVSKRYGGAKPNAIPTVQLGKRPPLLSLAVTVASDSHENYLEMVRTLLEHGADYN